MGELVERTGGRAGPGARVVDRGEAIAPLAAPRRDDRVPGREGRFLVHRRAADMSRFPGQYNFMVGGAAEVGESYEEAAARELTEELGVRVPVRFAFKFLCRGEISPYWLGVHEAVVRTDITPDPDEIAWHAWVTEDELREMARRPTFVADSGRGTGPLPELKRAGPGHPPPRKCDTSAKSVTLFQPPTPPPAPPPPSPGAADTSVPRPPCGRTP
jgi:8-oxo-dGTP pyrophosphatase MutT (NUDIX family)